MNRFKLQILLFYLFLAYTTASPTCLSTLQCQHFKPNSICANATCICPLGFTDTKSECRQFHCNSTSSCNDHFPNAQCIHGTCSECAHDFSLNPLTQTCYQQGPIGSACAHDLECGNNAICQKGKCGCLSEKFKPLKLHCEPKTCFSNSDCSKASEFSFCKNSTCTCFWGYQRDQEKGCVSFFKEIDKEACADNSQCTRNAFCDAKSKRCQCKLGFQKFSNPLLASAKFPTDYAKYHCAPYKCHKPEPCLKQFPRSTCFFGTCICEESYYWDANECKQIKQSIGETCSANFDCGIFAYCDVEGKCKCAPGSSQKDPGNANCRPKKCNRNAQCEKGSVCDELKRKCLPDGSVAMGDVPCFSDADCLIVSGRCANVDSVKNKTGICFYGNGSTWRGNEPEFWISLAIVLVAMTLF